MRTLALLAIAALVALAGCTVPAAEPRPDEPWPQYPPSTPGTISAWPSVGDALIRPGVQVVSPTGQCTSNFVFASPDNATLYLGLAAHCVEGLELGTEVDIGKAAKGRLAYSSWATMADIGEKDEAVLDVNDFALIEIDPSARKLVHPSVRHFGGPTALADSGSVARGDKVLTYGNSGLRQQIDPASWHEGYVVETRDRSTTVYTVTPGVPGDSGSAVLTGDGRALGILVTLTILPTTGSNGVTHLDRALDYAREHAGLDARLATWPLEDPGLLPPLP
ncbi:MAG TPA: trypsin-like peptidase domain-containing protein [Candidatus Thermoplasmatota archaeon]|nr:trypsin-like peptidase domain-containing protein [Candidatus Thermoplasmatota archaeon]